MTNLSRPRVAVLGGESSLAGAHFQSLLLRFYEETPWVGVQNAGDLPDVLHLSASVPGLSAAGLEDEEVAFHALLERVRFAEKWGAELIVFPSTCFQAVLPRLCQATALPTMTLWDITERACLEMDSPWLVLAPSTTYPYLRDRLMPHVDFPLAREARMVDDIIAKILAGREAEAAGLINEELLPLLVKTREEPFKLFLASPELCSVWPHRFVGWIAQTDKSLSRLVGAVLDHFVPEPAFALDPEGDERGAAGFG